MMTMEESMNIRSAAVQLPNEESKIQIQESTLPDSRLAQSVQGNEPVQNRSNVEVNENGCQGM